MSQSQNWGPVAIGLPNKYQEVAMSICDTSGLEVARGYGSPGRVEAVSRRIVDTWNACIGIRNPAAVAAAVAALRLVASLRPVDYTTLEPGVRPDWLRQVQAALAALEARIGSSSGLCLCDRSGDRCRRSPVTSVELKERHEHN